MTFSCLCLFVCFAVLVAFWDRHASILPIRIICDCVTSSKTLQIQCRKLLVTQYGHKPSGPPDWSLSQFLQHEAFWSISLLPPGWDASPSQGYPKHQVCQYPFIHLGGQRYWCQTFIKNMATQLGKFPMTGSHQACC